MKVMVVDDQANSRLLLHDLLASQDYVSVQAEDGQAAWDMMHRERPDMVITDILMPRMDGFELCKKIKLDPELGGTAVIFYSAAFVAPEDERLAMDLGASRFVIKPSEPLAFLDIIDAVMEQQRSGTLPTPERLSASLAELDFRHQERLVHALQGKIQELESSRRAFTTLIGNLPGMVYRCRNEPDWTMEFVSEACLELTGFPPEALVDNRDVAYGQLILADDRDRVWQAVQAARAENRAFQIEYRIRRRDGAVIRVWEQGRCVDLGATDERIEGYITDVTAQRRAELDRNRFFELSLDLLCIAGTDGYFKQVSSAWPRTLGWSEAELLARPWIELIHPDDRAATEQARATLVEGRQVFAFENRYRHKDGGYRWLSWNSTPLPEEGLIYAVARDFTDRIEYERKLRLSEERLDLALEFGELGAWDLDLIKDTAWRSLRHDQIFGYESLQAEWNQSTATRHIVPDDREAFTRSFDEARATGQFLFEGRVAWPDQSEHWVLARGRTLYDDGGQPARMVGTVMDISRHVEDQQRLEQLNRALRTLSAGNRALVEFMDESTLLDEMCRVVVEEGGYAMAWVGYARQDATH